MPEVEVDVHVTEAQERALLGDAGESIVGTVHSLLACRPRRLSRPCAAPPALRHLLKPEPDHPGLKRRPTPALQTNFLQLQVGQRALGRGALIVPAARTPSASSRTMKVARIMVVINHIRSVTVAARFN